MLREYYEDFPGHAEPLDRVALERPDVSISWLLLTCAALLSDARILKWYDFPANYIADMCNNGILVLRIQPDDPDPQDANEEAGQNTAPLGSRYQDQRHYLVAVDLDQLHGPVRGLVRLDRRLDWSNDARYDLGERGGWPVDIVRHAADLLFSSGVEWG